VKLKFNEGGLELRDEDGSELTASAYPFADGGDIRFHLIISTYGGPVGFTRKQARQFAKAILKELDR
jgi:hypothetical protein